MTDHLPDLDRRLLLLEERHQRTDQAIQAISASTERMSEALMQLALLEQRHIETRDALTRAFKAIERMQTEVDAHGDELVELRPIRRLTIWHASAVAGATLVGLIGLIFWLIQH